MREILSQSQIYLDYERAFTEATGLPLMLSAPEHDAMRWGKDSGNPFCALMARSNQACAACFAMQCQLEREASLGPRTLKCFAGLCETAVPVRVGADVVAFLRTGQVLLQRPGHEFFQGVAKELLRWGADVDLKRAEEAWFATRVFSPEQYEALTRMLAVFAQHLEACGNALALEKRDGESESIRRAKGFIVEHLDESLPIAAVARVVNMSAHYFSEKFKQGTGLTFTEYVGRVRVEKARNLLQNPNLSVSEIAYEVGFQSLSQFNRLFRKYVGQAPTAYRRGMASR